MDDAVIHYGSAIKALGGGKVGGYLVLFGTPGATDLEGDYFTPDTDYGDAKTTPVYYQHGMDAAVGKRKIGAGELRRDDVGVWIVCGHNANPACRQVAARCTSRRRCEADAGRRCLPSQAARIRVR